MKTRFVAYNRLGAKRGVLTHILQADIVPSKNELPTLTLTYPRNTPTHAYLNDSPEIAFEYYDNNKWIEPDDARFVLQGTDFDHLDDVPTKNFNFIGLGEALKGVFVSGPNGLPRNDDGKVQFGSANPGSIISHVWDYAVTRGWKGFTKSFTATTDSAGKPWPTKLSISFADDTSIDGILGYFERSGLIDYSWSGRKLNVYVADTARARDLTTGSDPLRFNLSGGKASVDSAPESHQTEGVASHVVVVGEEGLRWTFPTGAILPEGRREVFLSYSGVDDEGTARILAAPTIAKYSHMLQNTTRQFQINESTQKFPYIDYRVGDWVWVEEENGTWERVQIFQLALLINNNGVQGYISLGDKIDSLLERLNEAVQRVQGGTLTEGTNKPETSLLAPAAPTDVVMTTVTLSDNQGRPQGVVGVNFIHDGRDINGDFISMDRYEVQYRRKGTQGWSNLLILQAPTQEGTYSWLRTQDEDGTLIVYQFRVIAFSSKQVQSKPSAVVDLQMKRDTEPPGVPAPPTVTVELGVFTVTTTHNTTTGLHQPNDYSHVVVQMASSPSGPWVDTDTIVPPMKSAFIGGQGYVTRHFRLIAVDWEDNRSNPSSSVSATTKPLVDTDIILAEIDAAKTQIKNASKIIIESGVELGEKLADNDKKIADTTIALTGPGGLTERLKGAETKLADVGALTYASGQTLRQKLAEADTAIETTASDLDTLKNVTLPHLNVELGAASNRILTAEELLALIPGQISQAKAEAIEAAVGRSVIANGGFEDGMGGWQSEAGGTVIPEAARTGLLGMRLDPSKGNAWPVTNPVPTATGRTYRMEMWVRRHGTDTWSTQSLGFVVQTQDQGGVNWSTDVVHVRNTAGQPLSTGDISDTTFTRVQGEFTIAQPDAVLVSFAPWAYQTDLNYYDIDDFAVSDMADVAEAMRDAQAAQLAADQALKDAAAAAGIAKGKTKTLIQNDAPGADDRNAQTLWIDTTNGANTPKRWVSGTNWAAITDKVAIDAASAAAAAKKAADAAQTAADNAAGKATTALSRADAAMEAAGSLNQVFYSTSGPSGVAPIGSTWRQRDSAYNIIAEWQYIGGTNPWKPQLVSSTALSNVDIGKLTAGAGFLQTLVAEKIAAGTASFQTVDAKNIFVTGTASLDEVVAKRFAADTGKFLTLGVEQLTVTGSAKLKTAVADQLFTDIFTTNKLTAQQAYIGGSNLFAASMDDAGWSIGSTITQSATGGRNNDSSILITGSASQVGAYFGLTEATHRAKSPRLIPGQKYRASAWVKGSVAIPKGAASIYMRLYPEATGATMGWALPNKISNDVAVAANVWHKIEGFFEVPEGAAIVAVPGVYSEATYSTGTMRFSGFTLQDATTADLIVEGGILAKHITASQEMSAKLGQFLKVELVDLVSTGTANLNTAVITKLWTEVVRSRMITTDMLLVGKGTNLIPNGDLANGKEGWNNGYGIYVGDPAAVRMGYPSSIWVEGNNTYSSSTRFSLKGGQKYQFSMYARANTTGKRFYVQLMTAEADASNPYLVTNQLTYTGSFREYGGEFVAPEGATAAYLRIFANHTNGTTTDGHQWFTGFELYEKNGASLIVDGGILTKHLTVTEDMTVALLKAHKVKAGEIDVNSLTADTGFIGTMRTKILVADVITSTHIKADAVDATQLKSNAITAKHSITGAILQTDAAANSGIRIDTVGLRAWTASNTESLRIVRSTGDLTIYNGTIQTSVTANRGIKLNKNGLFAYTSSGKAAFILDAAQGDAQFDSRVVFGTQTTPKWVIVPWTSTTDERAGIWLVNPTSTGAENGIGGTNTGGMFMENSNATFMNPMHIRGANGGGVKVWGRLQSDDMYSGTIQHAGGNYKIWGANGSYFNSQVIFNGRIAYAGAPSTTSAANAHIASADGTIWKSSSASRFKIDPKPMDLDEALLDVPVEDWIDRAQFDQQQELMAEPRPHTEATARALEVNLERVPGSIAEKVEAAGGKAFVTYDKHGVIEGLSYDRFALARTAILKQQLDRALARIEALEGKI